MPERCPKCLNEMTPIWSGPSMVEILDYRERMKEFEQKQRSSAIPLYVAPLPPQGPTIEKWVCPLDPKDCRIKELETELEDANARHRKSDWCREQNWQEVLSTRSERDAALAKVGVLTHHLQAVCHSAHSYTTGKDELECLGNRLDNVWTATDVAQECLEDISTTARQFVERIEQEALEKAWSRVLSGEVVAYTFVAPAEQAFRAAILGEKES